MGESKIPSVVTVAAKDDLIEPVRYMTTHLFDVVNGTLFRIIWMSPKGYDDDYKPYTYTTYWCKKSNSNQCNVS